MTPLLKLQDPISVSRARLSFLPLAQPLPTHRHLVAPEQAPCGDFIGIFGGVSHRPDLGLKPELFIDALSAAEEKRMKEITATPFAGIDHHRIVQQALMAEKNRPYPIYLDQFSEAILYAHSTWLQGLWGQNPARDPRRPLLLMMEGASTEKAAEHCLEKTKHDLKTFHLALPAQLQSNLNLHLALPHVEDVPLER